MFYQLTGSRGAGEGVRAIPVSEIQSYFETWGIYDEDDRETHDRFIRVMDTEFLDHSAKRAEEARRKAGGK